MRHIETAAEWAALLPGREGYIYNESARPHGWPGHSGNTLHRADCTILASQRHKSDTFLRSPKYFAADVADAVAWLERERGQEGMEWRRCGRCIKERRLPAGTG